MKNGDTVIRDVVALSTLPAVWLGAELIRISESLAAALFTTVQPEVVCVCVTGDDDSPPVAVAQTGRTETNPAFAEAFGPALLEWARTHDPDELMRTSNPQGGGHLVFAARSLGVGTALGVIAAGFSDDAVPDKVTQLLLNIAATQATTAIEHQRLHRAFQRSELRLAEQKAAAEAQREALRQEAEIRETLGRVGASLARELDPDKLVQAVTDAATSLTTAEFGAFFYNVTNDSGDSYQLYTLSGAPREAFADFVKPRATAVFGPTFRGEGVVRLDDVTKDPRYGRNPPYYGMPKGHLPVRSYLAVPVIARSGTVLGGLFFGHSRIGVFSPRHEQLAAGVAAWAAIALDNARLHRDLEDASRSKDEFLATLSHELRTPLNAMLGWSQMLRVGIMQPDVQRKALESLERNAWAQAKLVEDLLDVSRIISGKLQIKADVVDLATVVRGAADAVKPSATAKRIRLHAAIDPNSQILVTGDADRLQQVVWNLLSNAIKFTPTGGQVNVELNYRESKAEIVVQDSGQGIDPAFLPHVFERFRQADSTPARRHGGLGLGLAIVRHLAEAHGGSVRAESPGPGHGAAFTITLPIRAVATQFGVEVAPEPCEPAILAGVRALVVDDEPDARDLIRYVLESRGAHVTVASSAGEALLVFRQEPFDVLIADIGMPEQDGYALVRAIRSLSDGVRGRIPAIAVTAYASYRDRDVALNAGYNWHLAKPVAPEQLIAAVAAAMNAGASTSS